MTPIGSDGQPVVPPAVALPEPVVGGVLVPVVPDGVVDPDVVPPVVALVGPLVVSGLLQPALRAERQTAATARRMKERFIGDVLGTSRPWSAGRHILNAGSLWHSVSVRLMAALRRSE